MNAQSRLQIISDYLHYVALYAPNFPPEDNSSLRVFEKGLQLNWMTAPLNLLIWRLLRGNKLTETALIAPLAMLTAIASRAGRTAALRLASLCYDSTRPLPARVTALRRGAIRRMFANGVRHRILTSGVPALHGSLAAASPIVPTIEMRLRRSSNCPDDNGQLRFHNMDGSW
jgi:hypothetical protein